MIVDCRFTLRRGQTLQINRKSTIADYLSPGPTSEERNGSATDNAALAPPQSYWAGHPHRIGGDFPARGICSSPRLPQDLARSVGSSWDFETDGLGATTAPTGGAQAVGNGNKQEAGFVQGSREWKE